MANPLMITDSANAGALKNLYAGWREKIFPMSTVLLANVEKAKAGGPRNVRWGGNGVIADIVVSRPVGMIASQSGYLGRSSSVPEVQITFPIKRLYVTREIDNLSFVGTQSKEASFVNLYKKIIEEAKDAARLGMQEVLHGNGRGIKALVGSRTSDTEYVLTSPYGTSGAGQGGLLIDVGMYVAFLDATDSFVTVLGRAEILTAVNSGDNCTITVAAVTGVAAGDAIVPATASDTSLDAYPNGLQNITNRAAGFDLLHGQTAATHSRWNSIQMVAGTDTDDANVPSESDIWDLITRVAGVSGKNAKEKPSDFLLLTTPGLEKKFGESYYGQRTLTPADFVNVKGGFKAITICGVPLVSDTWCPAGTIYLVHLPSLTWIDAKDWGEVQMNGAASLRFIDGRDAYQLSFGAFLNFGTVVRNSHGSIRGYTDTRRFSHVQ